MKKYEELVYHCPSCGQGLDENSVWASFDTPDLNEAEDYEVWFLTCEDCQENFTYELEPIEEKDSG
ncbi:MAG TPA: hypothetical protein ENI05_09370 [Porticoccus sp.]|nr:hypothetical protein [Porticoccus sp.]